MDSLQEFLCRIGWHDWDVWEKPKFGNYRDTGGAFHQQHRTCKCCSKYQEKTTTR